MPAIPTHTAQGITALNDGVGRQIHRDAIFLMVTSPAQGAILRLPSGASNSWEGQTIEGWVGANGFTLTGATSINGASSYAVPPNYYFSALKGIGSLWVVEVVDALGTGGGVVQRTLDLAGPELVNVASSTDSSNAGGATSILGTKITTTNTSGTARRRLAIADEIGQRYALFVQNVLGSVAGSVAVGTTAGAIDYLTYTTNPAVAARAAVLELTATTSTLHLQVSAPLAGTLEWDNLTLRKLSPTSFSAGTTFTHDFSGQPNGAVAKATTPDGLLWREMVPQNSDHVYGQFSGGKLTATASGNGTKSACYPYLHLGTGKTTGIHCDISWSGAGGTVAMVALTPTGTLPTVANILANSLHVPFTDTKVDVQVYVAGVLTTIQTITYPVACALDGTVYPDVGWFLNGTTLVVRTPDGITTSITDTRFATVTGPVAIPEPFFTGAGAVPVAIGKVAVRLG